MYHELSRFPVEGENSGFISCVAVWLKCSSEIYNICTPQTRSESTSVWLPGRHADYIDLVPCTPHSFFRPTDSALCLHPQGKQAQWTWVMVFNECLQHYVVCWSFPLASADDGQDTGFHKHNTSLLMRVTHFTPFIFFFSVFWSTVRAFYTGSQMQPELLSEWKSNIIIINKLDQSRGFVSEV